MISGFAKRRPQDSKILLAQRTSSSGSAVKLTLIVFPMPERSIAPIPHEDFTIPQFGVPASVIPK
jgi:hypothetical protein